MVGSKGYNVEYLRRKIRQHSYISFDMFDTLVKRNIESPTDVFDVVELEYNKNAAEQLKGWKTIRIEAESSARNEVNNFEPNLDEIYKQIDLPDKEKKILKELELKWELRLCQRNVDFYPVYKYAKQHAKKIFVTSDMYLDAKTIKDILHKAGIEFDKLYLSNEVKVNKSSGEVFNLIVEENNLEKKQLLHIGDSKKADFWGAKRAGVDAALIPKKINNLRYYKKYRKRTLNEKLVLNYINNNLMQEECIYYRIGFEVLGIVLLGYAEWLKNELRKQKIDKVFFLAREGALLKKVFELVTDSEEFKTKYLYVSRRSTRSEMLVEIMTLEEACEKISIKNNADFETLWLDLGLTDSDGKPNYRLMQKVGVLPGDSIKNWKDFDKIKHDIQENAANELSNLAGYLRQEGFSGKLAVADIGWRGTMQKSLTEVAKRVGIKVDINGYYVGLILSPKEVKNHKGRHGYLFQGGDRDNKEIRGFVGLFESMFLADHGSTTKYQKNGKVYQPVFAKFEYSEAESRIWREIQRGAMDFVKGFKKELSDLIVDLNPQFVGYGLKKLGHAPSMEDAKLFGDIAFLNTKVIKIAQPKGILTYAVNPKQLMRDLDACYWKVGFLKRLCKIKINYYNIYKIMAKKQ